MRPGKVVRLVHPWGIKEVKVGDLAIVKWPEEYPELNEELRNELKKLKVPEMINAFIAIEWVTADKAVNGFYMKDRFKVVENVAQG